MGFNCLKATEPLRGGSLLFTTKLPDIPGTHFIDLGRMKAWVDLGANQVFNTGPLNLESSALITRPFLVDKMLKLSDGSITPRGLYATTIWVIKVVKFEIGKFFWNPFPSNFSSLIVLSPFMGTCRMKL